MRWQNFKNRATGIRESGASLRKRSDVVDRRLLDVAARQRQQQLEKSSGRAQGHHERDFNGEIDELGESPISLENMTNEDKLKKFLALQGELNAGIITQEEYNRKVQEFNDEKIQHSRKFPSQVVGGGGGDRLDRLEMMISNIAKLTADRAISAATDDFIKIEEEKKKE